MWVASHRDVFSVTDAGGVSAEEVAARLGALSTAARGLLGGASIERGLLLAGALEGRWRAGQERTLLGGKGKVLALVLVVLSLLLLPLSLLS